MSDRDRLGRHRPDQAGDHVAQRVPLARFGAVRSDVLPRPTVQPLRARGHRDQIAEPVSAVHVQALGYGPEAVRRVQVAVAPDRMLDPPAALVVVGELELAQIMQIAALRVQQLAEQALADHTENHHLGAVVADVLHHHAVPAGPFGRFDQVPALVDGDGHRHLSGGVLAGPHRCEANRRVPLPRRRGEHQIELLLLAHAAKVVGAARITGGARPPGTLDESLYLVDFLRDDVAHGGDCNAVDLEKILDVARSLMADADEPDPHRLERRGRKQPANGTGVRRRVEQPVTCPQSSRAEGQSQAGGGGLQELSAIGTITHGASSRI